MYMVNTQRHTLGTLTHAFIYLFMRAFIHGYLVCKYAIYALMMGCSCFPVTLLNK